MSGTAVEDLISFESVKYPGWYIREIAKELFLVKKDTLTSEDYLKDATFKVMNDATYVDEGLNTDRVTLQSLSHPTFYVGPVAGETRLRIVDKESEIWKSETMTEFNFLVRY